MSSRFRSVIVVALVTAVAPAISAQTRELRVCADPDNLPFSDRRMQGFENRIADVLARELGAMVQYTWQRMGRGFVRTYLNTGECDVLIGVPGGSPQLLTTTPYYRSTFVFVSRRERGLDVRSLADPRLRALRIGVQFGGEGYTAPGFVLGQRGVVRDLVPFAGVGPEAPAIINAVVQRQVDLAIAWGPLAGYAARHHRGVLRLTPVAAQTEPVDVATAADIAIGMRKGETRLREELQRALAARQAEIDGILSEYGVVRIPLRAEGVGD